MTRRVHWLWPMCILLPFGTAHGQFTTVINVPPDPAPTSIGSDTQLNIFAGGALGAGFQGGAVDGSSTNIEINMDGGTIGLSAEIAGDVVFNISGGTVGNNFVIRQGSVVNVSGGSMGGGIDVLSGGQLHMTNGAIGSFQSFTGSEAHISGGSVGNNVDVFSVAFLSGGTYGRNFDASNRSEIEVSGGEFLNFRGLAGSTVDLIGSDFVLDGVPLVGLTPGVAFEITDRDVNLSGVFENGNPFSFDLNTTLLSDLDYFSTDAMLTVTLAPVNADFDGDGDVDGLDLGIWETAYGVDDLADADHDHDSDGADFLAWQSQYTGALGPLKAATVVPEPRAAALLFACTVIGWFLRRGR